MSKNNANVVFDILEGRRILNMRLKESSTETVDSRKVKFKCWSEEDMEYDILIPTLFGPGSKSVTIPFDFDEIDSLEALLCLVAAFTAPDKNVLFIIETVGSSEEILVYEVKNEGLTLETGRKEISLVA